MNYDSIKNDLSILTKLMHIARNLLVNAEPQVPQDICAAVHFDQMVYQTIILCVNVTSKGYDGEILDEADRLRLAEITELCQCATHTLHSTCTTNSSQIRSCSLPRYNKPTTGPQSMIATKCHFGSMFSLMTMAP